MAKNSMKPRIRFKGFTDAWEQRKLGGEAEELLAGGDIDKDLICESGRYPVIANALTNDGIVGFYEKYYRVEAPAVTVSGRGDVGHAQARRVNFTPVVRLLSIKSRHNVDFLENAINRGEVIIESTGVPQLTVPQLSKRTISFPQTVQEEEKIGKLFFKIDNLITLHQRKYDKIVNIKKALLEKMFPAEGEEVPKIRFKGFTEAWEQREFNSIAKRITEMTDTEDLPRVEYEDIVSGQGTLNKDINKKKSCKTGILFDNGDVLFGKLRPYLKNWLFATFMGIAVGDFWVLRANNADGLYIYTLLQIDAFQDIANQSTGTKMPRADWSLVSKQRFLTPTVVPEQRKIGEFFKQLDNLITLHQCKDFALDTNKAFQQRCLLSIKSANAWEQRKLGEMGETYAGLSSKSKEDFGHGEAEFVPYMNVFTNPIADVAMTEAIEIDDRQAKVKNGDVLFTTSSETPEEVGMSSVWLKNGSNTYLNSFCFGFRASESINSYYLAYMLRSSGVRRKIVFLAQGISRYNISKKKMMEIKVPMPISAEQRQLGEIFRQLDNLITLHQRKQTIKKRSKMDEKRRVNYLMIANAWEQRKLREVFDYERPDTYIVKSDKYSDTYSTPVLTANKGFILGYTNEMQVCNKECIIFDDFTLDSKYVTFPFMVKSSALKILTAKIGYFLPFAYQLLQATNIEILGHARHYISVVQPTKVLIPSNDEQIRIGKCIQQIDNLITLHQRGLIKIQGDKKWQKRKFQKNCSAIILNAG